jgi:hypothetical protein
VGLPCLQTRCEIIEPEGDIKLCCVGIELGLCDLRAQAPGNVLHHAPQRSPAQNLRTSANPAAARKLARLNVTNCGAHRHLRHSIPTDALAGGSFAM